MAGVDIQFRLRWRQWVARGVTRLHDLQINFLILIIQNPVVHLTQPKNFLAARIH